VVNLDALTYAGSLENLQDLPAPERHRFVEGDIGDAGLVESLLRTDEIDAIVHFAAESHVDRSIEAPEAFVQTNVVGTFTLLEAARRVWSTGDRAPIPYGIPFQGASRRSAITDHRFLHISTDEVFGSLGPDDAPFSESTPYSPNSPYAASKAAGDHLVRAYHATYGLPTLITNGSNNYGPNQFPEKLIPLMILNALEGKPLPVYGDGGQIRDWIYVEDHCEALLAVLEKGRVGETYVIGGGVQPTNLEVITELCSVLDDAVPNSPHRPHRRLVSFVADRPGHDRRYAMDSSKLNRELGWAPRHNLSMGLRETVEWYLSHMEWTSAIVKRPSYQHWLEVNYSQR
jgi:dTDP-glucose 4,6-dehydratase